jgi:hypothetical protein
VPLFLRGVKAVAKTEVLERPSLKNSIKWIIIDAMRKTNPNGSAHFWQIHLAAGVSLFCRGLHSFCPNAQKEKREAVEKPGNLDHGCPSRGA